MICLQLGKLSSSFSCVWISNGLYIGFVLCINPRQRNRLLPVALLINYIANRLGGIGPGWSLGLTLGDLAQILVATLPWRRFPVHAIKLTETQNLMRAGWYACLLGAFAQAAVVGVWARSVLNAPLAPSPTLSLFCANAVGAAVAVPLYWYARRKPKFRPPSGFKYQVELSSILFCAVTMGVFWQTSYPFLFLLFPFLIPMIHASAFVGAGRAVLVATVAGVVATAYGHGPLMLMHMSQTHNFVLQFFIAVVLLTAFPFATLVIEREQLLVKLQTSEAKYRELSRLDGLTQLPNRREFDRVLEISRMHAIRQSTPISLLMIDIDYFKKLNDQHGHTTGDEYLRRLALAIAEAVPRKTDLVARYGGEEFGVVLDSCDTAGALLVAERIQSSIATLSLSFVSQNKPPVSVSIGVASILVDYRTSAKVLIDAADQGLYTAKRNGRNRIERGAEQTAPAGVS